MVLLDDSNSYWWLVRVVKDSSIGTRRLLWRETNTLAYAVQVTCQQNISKRLLSG